MNELQDILEPGRFMPNTSFGYFDKLKAFSRHLPELKRYHTVVNLRIAILWLMPVATYWLSELANPLIVSGIMMVLSWPLVHLNFLQLPRHQTRNYIIIATLIGFLVNLFYFAYYLD